MAKKMVKMRYNGVFFEVSHYPQMYRKPGEPEAVRSAREKTTSDIKKRINARESRLNLMRTAHANYIGGRDLFVTLHFCRDLSLPDGRKLVDKFHRLMRKEYAQQWKKLPADEKRRRHRRNEDGEYRWLCTWEDHKSTGEPVDLHFHFFMSRCPLHRVDMLQLIIRMWQQAAGTYCGSVNVRTLDASDLFEDTARYFLKQRKKAGLKRWTKSRNHKPARKPVYKRIPENDIPDCPPGCKWIDGDIRPNEFGVYGWAICRIVDKRVFKRWWNRQLKDAEN